MKIHAWQGSHSVPLFEFHDKRHFMEFYLNFKVPYPKEYDEDHLHNPSNLSPSMPSIIREVPAVQGMVQNIMNNTNDMQCSLVRIWPGFASLITQA